MIGKKSQLANGRIVITDFRNLKLSDFTPLYNNLSRHKLKQEMIIIAPNGVLYVNRSQYGFEYVSGVFETLIKESKSTLLEYEEMFKNKFPRITNFDEWRQMLGTEDDKIQAFAMLAVPIELKRREIENQYY